MVHKCLLLLQIYGKLILVLPASLLLRPETCGFIWTLFFHFWLVIAILNLIAILSFPVANFTLINSSEHSFQKLQNELSGTNKIWSYFFFLPCFSTKWLPLASATSVHVTFFFFTHFLAELCAFTTVLPFEVPLTVHTCFKCSNATFFKPYLHSYVFASLPALLLFLS